MATPNADKEHWITYQVRQKTTSPNPDQVVQAFYDEMKLQFGSTIHLEKVTVFDAKERHYVTAKRPDKTYQEQREAGEIVEPDGDVVGGAPTGEVIVWREPYVDPVCGKSDCTCER